MADAVLRDSDWDRIRLIGGHGTRRHLPSASAKGLGQGGPPVLGAPDALRSRLDTDDSERQRELIAGVSHDLRGRLSSLQLVATALADGILEPELERQYLKQMPVHVGALVALVEDLFELSRLEAGDSPRLMQPVDIPDLVRGTVEGLQMEANIEGVSLRSEVPAGATLNSANGEKLERVLRNLIENAIHHTPRDGAVLISGRTTAAIVEVDVSDSGVGIPAIDRDHVFEPFMRGAGASPTGGTGLGLTVCRAIVEAHGGRIWLVEAKRGTLVRIQLPRSG